MCIRIFPLNQKILIHIPKNGGTSIAAGMKKPIVKTRFEIPEQYNHFEKMAIFRNPFDRFVSSFVFCRRQGWTTIRNPLEFMDRFCVPGHHQPPGTHCQIHAMRQIDMAPERADILFPFNRLAEAMEHWGITPVWENRTHRRPDTTEFYDAHPGLAERVVEFYSEDFGRFGFSTDVRQWAT